MRCNDAKDYGNIRSTLTNAKPGITFDVDEVTMEAMDDYILAVSKVMTQNEIKRLKLLLKNELDVDKKMKIALQLVELKKEDV